MQVQAAVAGILVAGIVLAASKPGTIELWDFACYGLGLAALSGETVADAQLQTFKEQRHGPNAICDTGLWALSRHPNYFFEWLVWLAIGLCALGFGHQAEYGWLAFVAPATMYVLLGGSADVARPSTLGAQHDHA